MKDRKLYKRNWMATKRERQREGALHFGLTLSNGVLYFSTEVPGGGGRPWRQRQVMDMLSHGPVTTGLVARILKIEPSNASTLLKRLCEKATIYKHGNYYRLKEGESHGETA